MACDDGLVLTSIKKQAKTQCPTNNIINYNLTLKYTTFADDNMYPANGIIFIKQEGAGHVLHEYRMISSFY